MKNIEEIREKLGPDYRVEENDGVITVCDIWDGVEFAIADYNGIIYKIDRFETSPMKKIWFSHGKFLFPEKCKPSTEAAYVDQLKAKAHELYGEIKDRDRFVLPWIGNDHKISLKDEYDFYYDKETDVLDLHGFPLYRQGKWAKKVDEPIRVKVKLMQTDSLDRTVLRFSSNRAVDIKDQWEFFNHIEEAIESYLNKIP